MVQAPAVLESICAKDTEAHQFSACLSGIAMAMAIFFFILGKEKYKHMPPAKSPVVRVAKVIVIALTHEGKEGDTEDEEQGYEDIQAPLLGNSDENNKPKGDQHWLDTAVGPGRESEIASVKCSLAS